MQNNAGWNYLLGLTLGLAVAGCSSASETSPVEYGSGEPLGRWASAAAGASGSAAAPNAPAGSSANAGDAAPGEVGPVAAAGHGSTSTSGGGRAGSSGGPAGSGAAEAAGDNGATGVGGAAGSDAAGSGSPTLSVTSLAFEVTTAAVGGRYRPKNIGAIWVQDGNGKLVKSLEVWAATRRRYLTKYVSVLAGSAVDVTSSATLASHRTHRATWNLKDRTGATAAPGKYKLLIELTDADTTGRSNGVDFDTSTGPQTLMPANAPSFSAMKLQLQ